ncbi:RuBisCO large subunit C-terminal-like domain-containing protein [Alicyclobacillus sp. ALC3]|uniref:RuBisCO large subunit C-terminal-like domain-containing protein n=1 Tax=Alicyclobacillus sp. ALC3 TaxID=2796143 RepID=UPI002377E18E|nr:RuBisCO large subunit C-terminal-like domain-containing protein [Alicyclobacillus sp. ALC3]WDL98552.1 hypothetical protein JC200_07720 [Alicyclobacillus sp. ALC3]
MVPNHVTLQISGHRFHVTYQVRGTVETVEAIAEAICVEQTVEFPRDLLPEGDIEAQIVGRVEAMHQVDEAHWNITISYASEVTGGELGQLINVVYGNASIFPSVRITGLVLPAHLLESFRGPRYGREGLRSLLGIHDRPLLCTALKPMGLSSEELASLAYEFAAGGIDIVKDDHGLANQPFSQWTERVRLCSSAVARANAKTGRNTIYMPSALGTSMSLQDKALLAKSHGAGGILVPPGIVGFDAVSRLADDDSFGLPIMSHPSFLGSHVTSAEHGINHGILFGQLMRLAGIDASVYPNYGGRFSFTMQDCRDIADGTAVVMGSIRSIFPTPGGGMTLDRVPEMLQMYGKDVILLIGGGLFRNGSVTYNTQKFLDMIQGKEQ